MLDISYKFIIDPGHGGIVNGKYVTPGKRSQVWEDGTQLFEGESNRDIAELLIEKLELEGLDCLLLVPEEKDISLYKRKNRVNKIWRQYKAGKCNKPILLSLHSNASSNADARGFEFYTTNGPTKADIVAETVYEECLKMFPDMIIRTDTRDGDHDKERQFYILRRTFPPAVLIENLFMTNYYDSKILMSDIGKDKISQYIFNACKRIELELKI